MKNIKCSDIEWINNLKVFAMLLVLLGHCFYYKIITPYGWY